MDEAIEDLHADGLVELTWLEGDTWRDLQRPFCRTSVHPVKFA